MNETLKEALQSADDLKECSECGHLHWHWRVRMYDTCPLTKDGCTCPMDDTK